MSHKWTTEHVAFLADNVKGTYRKDLKDMFNLRFGCDVSEGSIKSILKRNNLRSGIGNTTRTARNQGHQYTDEQIEFLKAHAFGRPRIETVQMFNERFGLDLSDDAVIGKMKRCGITNGIDRRFYKGMNTWNKGTKGLTSANVTSFKKGDRVWNHKPVGSETIRSGGYVWVKVAEPKKWRLKQLVVWEKVYGPKPKNHVLIFLDGDRTNCDLSNLKLISRKQLGILNSRGLLCKDKVVNMAAITFSELTKRVNELIKEKA